MDEEGPMLRTALLLTLLAAAPAAGQLATFDDLPDDSDPGLYAGVNWIFSSGSTLDTPAFTSWAGPNGYYNGTVSGDQVLAVFQTLTISGLSDFDLTSGYFTAAWRDDLNFVVTGYNNGGLLYTQNYFLNTSGPSFLSFAFENVDEVRFSASGGDHNDAMRGDGAWFALDDVCFNGDCGEATPGTVTPEPVTITLVGTGLAGIAARRRLRRN
jgi:hypothetical protein